MNSSVNGGWFEWASSGLKSHEVVRFRTSTENRKLWIRRIDLNEQNLKKFFYLNSGKWILICKSAGFSAADRHAATSAW